MGELCTRSPVIIFPSSLETLLLGVARQPVAIVSAVMTVPAEGHGKDVEESGPRKCAYRLTGGYFFGNVFVRRRCIRSCSIILRTKSSFYPSAPPGWPTLLSGLFLRRGGGSVCTASTELQLPAEDIRALRWTFMNRAPRQTFLVLFTNKTYLHDRSEVIYMSSDTNPVVNATLG